MEIRRCCWRQQCVVGGLLLLALWEPRPLRAQPALGGSLLSEQAFQARMDARAREDERRGMVESATPTGDTDMRVGAVRFSLTPAYALEYNDNVDTTPDNTEADWIHLPQLTVDLDTPLSERSDLSFSLGLGYRFYQSRSDLNRLFIAPGTQVAWDIQVKDVWVTVYDAFNYSQEVATEPGLSGQAVFPRFENTAGVRALWAPGKWVASAGYGYQIVFSDSTTFSYIDRNSHLLTLRGGYQWSPELQTGLEASGTVTDYNENINPDGTVASLGPYLSWRPSEDLVLSVRGGGVWYDNDATLTSPEESGSTWYAGCDLTHQLTDHIRHSLNVYRGLRLGVEAGSALIEQASFSYRASWNLLDPATVDLEVSYDRGQQRLPGLAEEEEFDQFRFGLGVSYRFTERLSANARYDLAVRESNDVRREYTQNRGQIGVAYEFN